MGCLRPLLVLLAGVALSAPTAAGDGTLCGTLADAFLAAEFGLAREWVVQVPFDSSAWRLEHVTVSDGLVVAQGGDGVIAAIAAVSQGSPPVPPGTVLWSRQAGRPGRSIMPAAVGSTIVAVADDLAIVGVDRMTGAILWRHALPLPSAAGPVASGPWIYAPGDGDGLTRLAADPRAKEVVVVPPESQPKKKRRREPERRTTETAEPRALDAGGTLTDQPVPFGNGVAWCATNGTVVVLVRTESEWLRHEFSLGGRPVGSLLVQGETIFTATTDGEVAAIELVSPGGLRTRWHVPLAESAAGAPILAGGVLVVPTAAGGAVGIDTARGVVRWRSTAPRVLLAADATRLWCVDATGRLALFDPATGTRLAWFCTGPFTLPVVNRASDRLVLATPSGTIVSLAPLPAVAVNGKGAPEPASADPAATPPAADRTTADPRE
jgi:outer membrane protein assembly factor BamB